MGSDSDLPTMKAAADMLEHFGVSYELTIVSAHRTPARMASYAKVRSIIFRGCLMMFLVRCSSNICFLLSKEKVSSIHLTFA